MLYRMSGNTGHNTELGRKKSQHSPVTFHLIAKFLDVAKPTAGVAFLLVGMVTLSGHVTSFAAGVAELLSLLSGLLAVPENVASAAAVVACCKQEYNSRQLVKSALLLSLVDNVVWLPIHSITFNKPAEALQSLGMGNV